MSSAGKTLLSVPEQIFERCIDHPDATAIDTGLPAVTYDELFQRARSFAFYLKELDIHSGSSVALSLERSIDWIVSALGIMISGAAYVPLDPQWPADRIKFAIEDSNASALVIRRGKSHLWSMSIVEIDPAADSSAIASAPAIDLVPVSASDLAYIIYTSGSTGVPKGVEITHANLQFLVQWHLSAFYPLHSDRMSHLAGLGFDAAGWEIWPTLCAGATLVLATEEVRTSPPLLHAWILQQHISIAFVPTALAGAVIKMQWPYDTSLRIMLTGGDKLTAAPTSHLPFLLVNNYGPTECTVVATSGEVSPRAYGTPSIGTAVKGATIYLLDKDGKQVVDGIVGEMYVGGAGVGRGYRNLPDLTEKYFLADPFSNTSGARMYRTGDLGLRNRQGEIEFRGRLDSQVKIRGQRVELDEISSTLMRHSAIAFATTTIDENADPRLIAFILFVESAKPLSLQDLQHHLLSSLPEFMVPPVMVRIDTLPLTANGKLDLAILPAVTPDNLISKISEREPANEIEEQLLAMVRRLLGNDTLGLNDNFFLSGGHSLLGMQVLLQIRETFGVEISLSQLFDSPTVESLAFLINAALDDVIGAMSVEEAEIGWVE